METQLAIAFMIVSVMFIITIFKLIGKIYFNPNIDSDNGQVKLPEFVQNVEY